MTQHPVSPATENAADAELVARAGQGDGTAFETIMRRHNQRMFRTARSILKNDSDAEDAVQEAYLAAWRALGNFRAEARLSTWLVRIVVNEALGRLRRKNVTAIPLDDVTNAIDTDNHEPLTETPGHSPEHFIMNTQTRKLLEAQIDQLPEAFRTVFVLRAVEEMSVEEVAQVLDIPDATVRSRYFRARGLMRAGLAQVMDTTLTDAFAFDGTRCDRIVACVLDKARKEGLCGG